MIKFKFEIEKLVPRDKCVVWQKHEMQSPTVVTVTNASHSSALI